MIRDILKTIYAFCLCTVKTICGADCAKKFDAKLRYGKSLNLKNPATLSDKICYLENHMQRDAVVRCTDKWEVRKFIKEKGLEQILVPVYGEVCDNVDDFDFSNLPEKFVLKATHGCRMNYVCSDKSRFDVKECKTEITRWLKTTYGTYSGEWHYCEIPHRFYCEKFLGDDLMDYKIHCINGKPEFILVCSERKVQKNSGMCVTLDLFDENWTALTGLCASGNEVPGEGKISKPTKLQEMLQIARELSAEFPFVRVDLYEVDNKIYFGELTFTPANGVFPYFTEKFNQEMGKKLRIEM